MQSVHADRANVEAQADMLRRLADMAPAMLAYWDSKQRCQFANQAFAAWFGMSSSSLVGVHIRDLLGELRYQRDRMPIEAALRGERQELERDFSNPRGGSARHAVVRYIPDFVGHEVRGFVAHLTDVSRLERGERRRRLLVQAGEVLSSSLDYSKTLTQIARLVVDAEVADMCIVDTLERKDVVRLTVAHRDPAKAEAAAKLAKIAIGPADALAHTSLVTGQPQLWSDVTDECLMENATNPEHLALLQELGPPRSALMAPLASANGVIGALVLVSTESRHFQPDDLNLAMDLAHRAAMAIENARLYEAARQATRARDEALRIVAHDVRNPIATIQLAASTLERAISRGRVPEGSPVRMILRASKRANRLIQDLLDIARIEGKALSLTREAIAPQQLIAEVLEEHKMLASSASISLDSKVTGAPPQVSLDRHRILQVFENLIGNAIKFTPRGGRIVIGAAPRKRDALFWVADTGPGISRKDMEHIFDRFWQLTIADRKGVGLGLPICRGIVEAHGGRIWAESEPGRGTTVFFTIPVAS